MKKMLRMKYIGWFTGLSIIASLVLAYSAMAYEKEINAISVKMAENIAKSGKQRIAVVDFTDLQGNVTELGRFIAEEFSVALLSTGQGFEVIDRTHLQSLLKEHKLSATGLIDPQTARKLGQIAGADALITGTITPFGESVRLSAKILDIETAKIIGANTGDIPKTKAIEELLGKGIETGKSSGAQSSLLSDSPTTTPHGKWKGKWTNPEGYLYLFDMDIVVEDITTVNGSIKWNLKISPKLEEQQKIGYRAVEYVKGSYNPDNQNIILQGYEKDDPYGIIGLGGYKLELSKDGKNLIGKSKNSGDWLGRFSAERE